MILLFFCSVGCLFEIKSFQIQKFVMVKLFPNICIDSIGFNQ